MIKLGNFTCVLQSMMDTYVRLQIDLSRASWWCMFSLTLLGLLCPAFSYNDIRSGRHVCVTGHASQTPVKTMQTYYKPVYKKHMRMCDNSPYRLCSSFRVAYELAYREVYTMRPSSQVVYACCPGWTQSRSPRNGCLEPVCSPPCQHGGRCTRPGSCKCQPGWTGPNCAADVDECASRRHRCEHKCLNTPGSYKCTCHSGFSTDTANPHSCQLCLTCIPQYQEQAAKHRRLSYRIETLEQQMTKMQQTLAVLEVPPNKHYEAIKDMVINLIEDHFITTASVTIDSTKTLTVATTSIPTDAPTEADVPEKVEDKDEHVMARIQSLTRQIAFLEERLGLCECNRR